MRCVVARRVVERCGVVERRRRVIEPRRFGLVVKDPRLPKRVDLAELVTEKS